MKRRHVLVATGAFASAGIVAGLVNSQRHRSNREYPIEIKFSHVVARDTPKGKAADYFKRIVEERSEGKVNITVFPNSELYKDKEELEALQLGAVHIIAPSLAKLGPLGILEFELFDLPFLFENQETVRQVTQGPVGRHLKARLADIGLLGVAFWDNGLKQMSANRKLVMPDDFRGLRMRIQSSEVLDAQMRALGAIPDAMALSEVYTALRSGVVDGTENPSSNFYTQKMYEVQRFLTLSNHGYLGYIVIVNQAFWQALPSDLRDLLEAAMVESTAFGNRIAKAENDAALEKIRAAGSTEIVSLTSAQRDAWKAALLVTRADFTRRLGNDLLDQVYKTVGR